MGKLYHNFLQLQLFYELKIKNIRFQDHPQLFRGYKKRNRTTMRFYHYLVETTGYEHRQLYMLNVIYSYLLYRITMPFAAIFSNVY